MGYFANPSGGLFLGGYSSIQGSAGQAKEVNAYQGIKSAVQATDPDATVDFLPGVTGGTSASTSDHRRPGLDRRGQELRRRDRRRRHRLQHLGRGQGPHQPRPARRPSLDDQSGRGRQPEHRRLPRDGGRGEPVRVPGHHSRAAVELLQRRGAGPGDRRRAARQGEPERAPALQLVSERQPVAGDHRLHDPAHRHHQWPHVSVLRRRRELSLRVRAELHHVQILRHHAGPKQRQRQRHHHRQGQDVATMARWPVPRCRSSTSPHRSNPPRRNGRSSGSKPSRR